MSSRTSDTEFSLSLVDVIPGFLSSAVLLQQLLDTHKDTFNKGKENEVTASQQLQVFQWRAYSSLSASHVFASRRAS